MGLLGKAVSNQARIRRQHAAAAVAFHLYALTHEKMRSKISKKNALIYKSIARELLQVVPAGKLPIPPEQFVSVLDALTTCLIFTYFQTLDLITEDVFVGAFEALVKN